VEDQVRKLRSDFQADLAAASSDGDLEEVRVRYLGQKAGRLTHLMRGLGKLPRDERPAAGQALNALKAELEQGLSRARQQGFAAPSRDRQPPLDPTLPGRPPLLGSLHPISLVRKELEEIFVSLGYSVEEGPEVESDFYNFEALNIPADHPARDDQDSFYAGPGRVLRTHTSPVQIRTMQRHRPPLKFIAPGMVFRRDAIDPNHTPAFFQLEGMCVGERVSLADLKGTLTVFWRRLFGDDIRVRFRPSYFPFVEPGAEVDISCILCRGRGCRGCGGSGWIEIMGAGMVHPEVFRAVGYDPDQINGFAFGMGIDRIAKLKYGIEDLRLFWDGDLRFLRQFETETPR
jgi:phenylalanyl-tRNA synthetase alpha chain